MDVDFSQPLPERILANMIDVTSNEKLLKFYGNCLTFNNVLESCNKGKNNMNRGYEEGNRQRRYEGAKNNFNRHADNVPIRLNQSVNAPLVAQRTLPVAALKQPCREVILPEKSNR